jgi:hypothetical protein
MVDERPIDADVATRRTVARLPQEPWQKGDVGGLRRLRARGRSMDGIIYLVGLIVIVMAILSFVGLR